MLRLALHGGAGDPTPGPRDDAARAVLLRVAADAWAMLSDGASAMDAVEAAVVQLEDCPLFNAGIGAVLHAGGGIELDAAIMDGATRAAGAVAGCSRARSPIRLAREILRRTPHVLFAGEAADRLNADLGLPVVDPAFFVIEERRAQLEDARKRRVVTLDHDDHYGTVGCVARDALGRLAAATSTGGLTNKPPGRIGDTPLIGAGTWADDRSVAVSCTGMGEAFIRSAFGAQVHGRVLFGGQALEAACDAALEEVRAAGGRGGCIAIGRSGDVCLSFTTTALYRAWMGPDGQLRSAIGR